MTIAEIRDRLEVIRLFADDDNEVAHSKQDRLWADVLKAIAKGSEDPSGLATEALKVLEIDFCRWCG